MDYESFKKVFADDIREKLGERGYEDVTITFQNIEKANENYEAITVVPDGSVVGVNFNIDNAFASYEHTQDYAGVLAGATKVIADGLDKAPEIDVNALMDYGNMKEKLSIEVISAETNADLLDKIPYEKVEDLAVVYRFEMESNVDERSSILITNDMIECMAGKTPAFLIFLWRRSLRDNKIIAIRNNYEYNIDTKREFFSWL